VAWTGCTGWYKQKCIHQKALHIFLCKPEMYQ
jgi:hypothetical protein